MSTHRLSDRAELLLQQMAAAEGKKPSQFLHDLLVDYAAGLTFNSVPMQGAVITPVIKIPPVSNPPSQTTPIPDLPDLKP